MKKLGFLLLFSIFLLLGCANNDDPENDYSRFLSDEADSYGVYIVADEEEISIVSDELWGNYNIYNISVLYGTSSLENALLSEVEEAPTYMAFDTEDKVYETHDREEFFEFLEEN